MNQKPVVVSNMKPRRSIFKKAIRFAASPIIQNTKSRTILSLLLNRVEYFHFGMVSPATPGFVNDERFNRAYEKAVATGSWHGHDPVWNCYVACWAAKTASKLQGDFVECGVYRGALASAIIEYVSFSDLDKTFFLIDSFEGVNPEQMSKKEHEALGLKYTTESSYYDDCYQEVKKWFEPIKNVKVIRGWIPEVLDKIKVEKISYLSIDMNCTSPEIDAIDFFWPKIVPGGLILLDDYGWPTHKEQKDAFDQFARANGVEIFALPTGQGLIVKPQT